MTPPFFVQGVFSCGAVLLLHSAPPVETGSLSGAVW